MSFASRIEALSRPETYAPDDVVSGLYCRRLLSGKLGLYVRYKVNGRWFRMGIGKYPALGVEEARHIAKRYLYAAALGRNPVLEKKQAKLVPDIDALYKNAMIHHWGVRTGQDWKAKVAELYRNHVKPTFGSRVAADITTAEVRLWHMTFIERGTKTVGNRALAVLSSLFSYADEMGYVAPGFNPTNTVRHHPERSRERRASQEELGRIVRAIEYRRQKYPDAFRYFLTLAFTGARPSVLYRAKLSDVSPLKRKGEEWGHLTHVGKSTDRTGLMETVLIPPRIWKLLKEGREPDASLTGVVNPRTVEPVWREILKVSEVQGLWMRDLRRTFASIGLSQGVSIGVLGEILNHQSAQTTKVYARMNTDEKMGALENIDQMLVSNGLKES